MCLVKNKDAVIRTDQVLASVFCRDLDPLAVINHLKLNDRMNVQDAGRMLWGENINFW